MVRQSRWLLWRRRRGRVRLKFSARRIRKPVRNAKARAEPPIVLTVFGNKIAPRGHIAHTVRGLVTHYRFDLALLVFDLYLLETHDRETSDDEDSSHEGSINKATNALNTQSCATPETPHVHHHP